ncbi:cyclodeaminase [Sneathiella sp. CAU 1612]|uniref:Cyclodeaminase n=1 Tax=Sneathiella sedimenti TaxID=2816034 RepID=A0ABS3F613_9PROT|nr:cyclodeaminase [Sneathiella sedimenti]MBO0333916.1 cyclodeaminase [Sneathiella sedimenti]
MPEITILNEQELRQIISLDKAAVDCIENAFRLLATKNVVMPPILSFHVPDHNGEVDVKTAYVPGIDSFAIKMSPGFFDNPKLGLPSLNGLMVLFSSITGIVESVLLDNGYLTDVRTAAAGAVAAKWLSRENSSVAGIVGTGTQARLQLKALCLVRNLERAFVWGRNDAKAEKYAAECSKEYGLDIQVANTIDDLMEQSDIVVTTTPSQVPLISAAQLRPGQHITAMGTDADYKTELAADVIPAADLYVCDTLTQCRKQGELRPAIAAGLLDSAAIFPELGGVIAGHHTGRRSDQDITICDLTGTGVQDTAIATFARERAQDADIGTHFNS